MSYSFSLKVLIYTKQAHKINCAWHILHRVLTKSSLVFMLSTPVVMHSHNKLQKYIDVLLWDKCSHASPRALSLFFSPMIPARCEGAQSAAAHGAPLKVCVCWGGWSAWPLSDGVHLREPGSAIDFSTRSLNALIRLTGAPLSSGALPVSLS